MLCHCGTHVGHTSEVAGDCAQWGRVHLSCSSSVLLISERKWIHNSVFPETFSFFKSQTTRKTHKQGYVYFRLELSWNTCFLADLLFREMSDCIFSAVCHFSKWVIASRGPQSSNSGFLRVLFWMRQHCFKDLCVFSP